MGRASPDTVAEQGALQKWQMTLKDMKDSPNVHQEEAYISHSLLIPQNPGGDGPSPEIVE